MFRSITLFIIFILIIQKGLNAQHTFSIVAIDTITGEVGSAGATCLDDSHITGGAKVISAVVPGTGAIHIQALLNQNNYYEAVTKLNEGFHPSLLIQWLVDNDATNNPELRQYGLAAFDSTGKYFTDAFTGENALDHKAHIIGPNYAIQGNILLGQFILDSMEARFLNTEGTLADKLIAAMQGANVAGSDSRCLDEGVSSLSAFLRIAKPDDYFDSLFLDLIVSKTPYGIEPIDSLQKLYNIWKIPASIDDISEFFKQIKIYPLPATDQIIIELPVQVISTLFYYKIIDVQGKVIARGKLSKENKSIDTSNLINGIYYIQLSNNNKQIFKDKFLISNN